MSVLTTLSEILGINNFVKASKVAIPTGENKFTTLDKFLKKKKTVKLWENPNPSNQFAAQNITLSSDDYDYLIWFYKGHESWNRVISQITLKGFGVDLFWAGDGQMSNGITWKIANFYRHIAYINNTTFSVPLTSLLTPNGDGYNGNGISDGGWCVPIAIYGGKF